MFTPEKLLTFFSSEKKFLIAYSGGQDSQVLLQAMADLRDKNGFALRAIHVNHGLSSNADQWATHCQAVCEDLKISLIIKKIKLSIVAGDSIEAVARQQRYQIFQELLQPNEILLTAHTLNDQTETFLLQLMRGAGIKGLSAMPEKKIFGHGKLWRPLLNFSREDLHHYAVQHQLQWIEDDSNLSLRFNRNFLRHQVLPVLQQRWPKIFTTISRSAKHCAQTAELLDELADQDLSSENVTRLSIEHLLSLSPARQTNALRRWIHRQGLLPLQTKQIEEIFQTVIHSHPQATPLFSWDQAEIRRYQKHLYVLPKRKLHKIDAIIPWDLQQVLVLPDQLGTLQIAHRTGEGITSTLDRTKITVRFRQGGERCQPADRKETHELKQLMQQWQIPPWQRNRVPLLFYGDTLIAVVGYCVCEGYVAKDQQKSTIIDHLIESC